MNPGLRPASGDEAARLRIRHSLHESLIVEASAGTGKTTELTARIVEVLGQGLTTVDRLVAVTFTHKAAGELKIRLRQKLDAARQEVEGETRARLEKALEELEEASIGTIHGFCAQILRARPVEARVDPAFEELTEQEATRLFNRAFDSWFETQLEAESPGLRRALARLAWRDAWERGSAVDQLRRAARTLVEWRDFTALWALEPFDRTAAIGGLLDQARELASFAAQCTRRGDNLVNSIGDVTRLVAWLDRGRVADEDTLEAVLLKLGRDLKTVKKGTGAFAPNLLRETVIRAYEALRVAISDFRKSADVLLASQLQREMLGVVDRYSELKARSGKLDFLDLLERTARLLRTDRDVRAYFANRFTHIFVDEFQDTDPLQAEVLLLLSADDPAEPNWLNVTPMPGKFFAVGDPKQSVYKFRRADVLLYNSIRDKLHARGVGRVFLTTSHRSVLGIQQFVNAAFFECMLGDVESAQAQYSPMDETGPELPSQPAVVALPVPRPYGFTGVTKTAINACLPETTAAYVHWLLTESGWKVRENDELVPVRSSHVCLLFRRFINNGEDLTRSYVKALEARGVPHLLVGSRTFHHRDEVETVRTALAAIEWPADELSVFATLRGSLFAIPDDLLFRFRFGVGGRIHPFRNVPAGCPEEFSCVRDALKVLARLHRDRNARPVADTINDLLEHVRAHAGFAMRPGGQQVLANVHRLCNLARTYEYSGGVSFRGFVEELEAQAEKDDTPEAPVLEEASEGVRLMTVHNAKGLEFPVVILADLSANLAAAEPERHIDAEKSLCAVRILRCAPRELLDHQEIEKRREEAEGVRVCYVAATRARDLLVVPTVGDSACEGWLSPLTRSLYPPRFSWRQPDSCDYISFPGTATVLDRPFRVDPEDEGSIKPGLHTPESGAHRVLWHDPGTLRFGIEESFGMRHIHILQSQGEAERGLAGWTGWQRDRSAVLRRASVPSITPVQPSDIATPAPAAPVTLQSTSAPRRRAAGPRFGSLVHAMLRDMPQNPAATEVAALAKFHGKLAAASPKEEREAGAACLAVTEHPLWRSAFAASRMHREYPVSIRLDEGNQILDGVIDLAFLSEEGWVVVDYKTDLDLEERLEHYERQLRWYMEALRRLTGQPARGVLLRV